MDAPTMAGLLFGLLFIYAAWLTSIVFCATNGRQPLLVAGAAFFPVGVVHGIGVWFGDWWALVVDPDNGRPDRRLSLQRPVSPSKGSAGLLRRPARRQRMHASHFHGASMRRLPGAAAPGYLGVTVLLRDVFSNRGML